MNVSLSRVPLKVPIWVKVSVTPIVAGLVTVPPGVPAEIGGVGDDPLHVVGGVGGNRHRRVVEGARAADSRSCSRCRIRRRSSRRRPLVPIQVGDPGERDGRRATRRAHRTRWSKAERRCRSRWWAAASPVIGISTVAGRGDGREIQAVISTPARDGERRKAAQGRGVGAERVVEPGALYRRDAQVGGGSAPRDERDTDTGCGDGAGRQVDRGPGRA